VLGHQPTTVEHDPRNDALTSAAQAHVKYDAIRAATGTHFLLFALETHAAAL
jgi:hypothetical protein